MKSKSPCPQNTTSHTQPRVCNREICEKQMNASPVEMLENGNLAGKGVGRRSIVDVIARGE